MSGRSRFIQKPSKTSEISTFSRFRLFLENDDVKMNDILMQCKIVKKALVFSIFGKQADQHQVRKSRFGCEFDRHVFRNAIKTNEF